MIVGELLPTHKTGFVLCFRGISMIFTPDCIRLLVAWTVDGLASKPYPRGQGETGFGSTSGGL